VIEKNVYEILRQGMLHKNNNTKLWPVFNFLLAQKSTFKQYKDNLYTVHKTVPTLDEYRVSHSGLTLQTSCQAFWTFSIYWSKAVIGARSIRTTLYESIMKL